MLASVLTFRFLVTRRRTSSRGESDLHSGRPRALRQAERRPRSFSCKQLFFEMELGDDPLEDGFALEDLYLCLEIIFGRVRTTFVGGGAHVAHVEEILIEILNLQGGTSLVDRCLRKREQERGEEAQESDQNQGAFVTPEDVPVFEQQAGAGFLDDVARMAPRCIAAAPAAWSRHSFVFAGRGRGLPRAVGFP